MNAALEKLRSDKAMTPDMLVLMLASVAIVVLVVSVQGALWWQSWIRTPVDVTVAKYTSLYANLGTDTPSRYQGTEIESVSGRAEAELANIRYVDEDTPPIVVCGVTQEGAIYTKTVGGTSATFRDISVPTGPLPANTPIVCEAAVQLKPWPFQGPLSGINDVLLRTYDAVSTGFSDGGANPYVS